MTLTDSMKKKLKIGAIILGAGALGFGIYKMTRKSKAAPSRAALSGVSARRRKKTAKRKSTKVKQLN